VFERLRLVKSQEGNILGRAVIPVARGDNDYGDSYRDGIITVGGVRSEEEISRCAGVLIGQTHRAARDDAEPTAADEDLAAWASEQGILMSKLDITPTQKLEAASVVCALGGESGDLIIAETRQGFLRGCDVEEWALQFDTIYLWFDSAFYLSEMERGNLKNNVLVVDMGYPIVIERLHRPRSGQVVQSGDMIGWDDLGDRCSKLIFKAWGLPLAECQRQLDEHRDMVIAYERKRGEYIRDDPNYPFTVEVGLAGSGKPFMGNVTILNRYPQSSS
jgi:hypothetical protein